MFTSKWHLLIFFCAFCLITQAQNINKIKLQWNYKGSLNNVLKAIGDDYNLHFVFDSVKLQDIQVTYYAFEENALVKLFDEWKNQWNLFTYIEKDRTIIISDKQLSVRQRKEWFVRLTQRDK